LPRVSTRGQRNQQYLGFSPMCEEISFHELKLVAIKINFSVIVYFATSSILIFFIKSRLYFNLVFNLRINNFTRYLRYKFSVL